MSERDGFTLSAYGKQRRGVELTVETQLFLEGGNFQPSGVHAGRETIAHRETLRNDIGNIACQQLRIETVNP
ncbi:MAG: hypothetical protein ACLTH3_01045 [Lachnospira sp.]